MFVLIPARVQIYPLDMSLPLRKWWYGPFYFFLKTQGEPFPLHPFSNEPPPIFLVDQREPVAFRDVSSLRPSRVDRACSAKLCGRPLCTAPFPSSFIFEQAPPLSCCPVRASPLSATRGRVTEPTLLLVGWRERAPSYARSTESPPSSAYRICSCPFGHLSVFCWLYEDNLFHRFW